VAIVVSNLNLNRKNLMKSNNLNIPSVSVLELQTHIAYSVLRGNLGPNIIWGTYGVAKSAVVEGLPAILRAAGVKVNEKVINYKMSQRNLPDLLGIPRVDGEHTAYFKPDDLPREGRDFHGDELCILFLDEIGQPSSNTIQQSVMQLINEGRVGSYTLPANVLLIAASNRATDIGSMSKMSPGASNRFAQHWLMESDPKGWLEWARNNGVNNLVTTFYSMRPDYLVEFPDGNVPKANLAFGTYRTAAELSNVLDTYAWADTDKLPIPEGINLVDLEQKAIYATVGQDIGADFCAFLHLTRSMEGLPLPAEVFNAPKTTALPFDPSQMYAVAFSLAQNVHTEDEMQAMFDYLSRLDAGEVLEVAVQLAVKRDDNLKHTQAYVQKYVNDSKLRNQ